MAKTPTGTTAAAAGTKKTPTKVARKAKHSKDDEIKAKGKMKEDKNIVDVKVSASKKKATPTRVTMGRKKKEADTPPVVAVSNLDFVDDDPKVPEEKTTTPKKPKAKANNNKKPKEEETSDASSPPIELEKEDLAACCLCHCALDYSDRSAFFEADRLKEVEEKEHDNKNKEDDEDASSVESLYFQPTDPYLPKTLYDPANALVYCDGDGCNRLYHQKCHFVPLMVVPRGKWLCLVCSTASKVLSNNKTSAKASASTTATSSKKKKKQPQLAAALTPFTKGQLKRMFQSPPPPAKLQILETSDTPVYHTRAEKEWEIATGHDKAVLWQNTLTKTIPNWIQSQMSNFSQAQTALETLTRTKQNRQHFLDNKASKRGSQELAQTLVKLSFAKWKMRQMILTLEEIRVNPERHIQLMQQWCQGELLATTTTAAAIGDGSSTLDKDNAAAKILMDKDNVAVKAETTDEPTTTTKTVSIRPPPKSFVERVIFPFGQHPPRSIPRTPEMMEIEGEEQKKEGAAAEAGIPKEIVTSSSNQEDAAPKSKMKKKTSQNGKNEKSKTKKAGAKKTGEDDDSDSSGVSLEDLKCCVCLIGDASDENDLLMCDAQGCFRAVHMGCLEPRLTLKDVENTEDEDWFCPLCSNVANCMHTIQSYYLGEEWDQRRRERAIALAAAAKKKAKSKTSPKGKKKAESDDDNKQATENDNNENDDDDDDDDSLKSWSRPDDVFPDSKWEYETALLLKDGVRNEATKYLLEHFLGEEEDGGGKLIDYMSDGTDDEELDAHFDLEAFHEERQRQYQAEEGDDDDDASDDSSHSSQATLVEMSSVELKIGKDELKALSDGSASDSSDEEDSDDGSNSGGEGRRRYRFRRRQHAEDQAKNVGVDFDTSNIVQGKRNRKPVDYRKLNDAMFGDLDAKEIATIDDAEDFQVRVQKPKKKKPSKSKSPEDEESGSGSDDDDDNTSGSGSDDDSEDENGSDDDKDESDAESTSDAKDESKKPSKKKAKNGSKKRKLAASKDDDDTDSGNEAENDDSDTELQNGKKKSKKKPPAKKRKTASAAKKATKKPSSATAKPPKKNGAKKENGGKTSTPKSKAAKTTKGKTAESKGKSASKGKEANGKSATTKAKSTTKGKEAKGKSSAKVKVTMGKSPTKGPATKGKSTTTPKVTAKAKEPKNGTGKGAKKQQE